MVTARSYFIRMNEHRAENWLTENQLLRGTEEFFKLNEYHHIEYNKVFDQGSRIFSSPIIASKMNDKEQEEEIDEMIVSIFKPKINHYDLRFFGTVESILFDVVDNYERTNLMLVTDSLSYMPITKSDELNVTIERMMKDGLYILFINHRFAYALFDNFENLTKPIPIHN